MLRECAALCLVALTPACSLILDFDQKVATDAAVDAVSTEAECDFFEPNDSLTGARDLDPTVTGPAAICAPGPGAAEDHDFYRFEVTGTSATVEIAFTSRPGGDLDLRLYAADGTMVAQSRGFADGESIACPGASPACPSLTPGAYIFEVLPGVAGAVNSYTLSVTQP